MLSRPRVKGGFGLPPSSPRLVPLQPPLGTGEEEIGPPGEGAMETGLPLAEGAVLARKYRLERPAGFGGMAQLWVATNLATGAEVCVKVLVPGVCGEEAVERFRREAHAAARLTHRAIIRIFDLLELTEDGDLASGEEPAVLAIVMELLHGQTLGDAMVNRGKVTVEEALDIAVPVISALAHAHRAGVVHRDIKPDNIFLATDPDGLVIPKVLDFGISKFSAPDAQVITMDGVMLGTPSFMSPEQANGSRHVDARTDVFSAGIVLYMMVAGQNPFECEGFQSVLAAIMRRDPPKPPELPDAIWNVLTMALAKDPDARFADCTEFGIALRRAAGRFSPTDAGASSSRIAFDSGVSVPPVGSVSDRTPPELHAASAYKRRPLLMMGGFGGFAGVVLLVVILFAGGKRSTSSPPSASAATTPAVLAAPPAPEPSNTAASAQVAPTSVPIPDAGASPAPRKARPNRKPSSGGSREPSIVRDPGF